MTRAKLNTELMILMIKQNQTLINLGIQDLRISNANREKLLQQNDRSEQIALLVAEHEKLSK